MSKKDLSTEYVRQKMMFKGQEIEVRLSPDRLEIRFDDAFAKAMGYRDLDDFILKVDPNMDLGRAIAITGKPEWVQIDGDRLRWEAPAYMN